MRLRYTLRCDDGYLLALHGLEGPPVTVVPEAERATSFVDFATAAKRAVAMQQLGWLHLRIIAFYLPLL